MGERATINQRIQFGVETTPGTSVPATKLVENFNVVFGVKPDVNTFRPTGRRWSNTAEENREWTGLKVDGNLDYQGMVYLISGPWGAATITTHAGGVNAKDWTWIPPVTGAITPKTYTIEQGDSTQAHKAAYSLLTDFGYKGTRKDFSCTGVGIAQALQNGITMTNSPTAITLSPIVGKHMNVWLDTTSAGIGTTQFTKMLSVDYSYSGGFNPFWPLNRANSSYSGHVDATPKNIMKILLEADAQGMSLLPYLQQGAFLYLRVDAQGPVIDNLQTVTLGGPSAGTFTLTYKGQTSAGIAFNAAASAVQTALIALSTIGAGNVTVTGSAGGPYTVTFAGTLANDTTPMTGSGAGLTGGAFLITQAQNYYAMLHDMALKLTNVDDFSDSDGIFAIGFEGEIVEDSNWNGGQSQKLVLTNALTAL